METIVAGGMCVDESDKAVDESQDVMNVPKESQAKKIIAGTYLVIGLVLGITDAVLEGIAINDCTSAIPVVEYRGATTTRYIGGGLGNNNGGSGWGNNNNGGNGWGNNNNGGNGWGNNNNGGNGLGNNNNGGNGWGNNNNGGNGLGNNNGGNGWVNNRVTRSTTTKRPWWVQPTTPPVINRPNVFWPLRPSFAPVPALTNHTFNSSPNSTVSKSLHTNFTGDNETSFSTTAFDTTQHSHTSITSGNMPANRTTMERSSTITRNETSSKPQDITATFPNKKTFPSGVTSSTTNRIRPTGFVLFSVDSSYGLYVWEGAFVVLIVVLLPLQAWLLTHSFCGTTLWKTKRNDDQEQRNPYCIAFKVKSEQSYCHLLCMRVNRRLFMLFEDIVHIFLSVGRIYFASESEANQIAFDSTVTGGAMTILIIVDSATFLVRWIFFYYSLPCKNKFACCRSFPGFMNSLFTILPFATSASSAFFSVVCPIYISQRPTPDDIAKYYGGFIGGVLLATAVIYWRCNRKSKKKRCCFC